MTNSTDLGVSRQRGWPAQKNFGHLANRRQGRICAMQIRMGQVLVYKSGEGQATSCGVIKGNNLLFQRLPCYGDFQAVLFTLWACYVVCEMGSLFPDTLGTHDFP
jgi:hypothetical protein